MSEMENHSIHIQNLILQDDDAQVVEFSVAEEIELRLKKEIQELKEKLERA